MLRVAFVLACAASVFPTLVGSDAPEAVGPTQGHFHGAPTVSFEAAIGDAEDLPRVEGAHQKSEVHQRGARDMPRVSNGPSVTIQPGVRLAPASERGFAIQGSVTQAWNLRDVGGKYAETADAAARVSEAEARSQALSARLEAAHAWIMLRGIERRLALAQEEHDVARSLRDTVAGLVEAGEGTDAELVELEAHVAVAQARVVELEGLAHDFGLTLALVSGGNPGKPLATEGPDPEPSLGSPAERAAALDRVEQTAAVQVAALREVEARARTAQASAVNAPQLVTGVQAQREGPGDVIVYGVIGMNFAGRQSRHRSRLQADLNQVDAEVDLAQARREAKSGLAQALHEVEHTELIVEQLEGTRLPALERLVERRAERRALGESNIADELRARQSLLSAKQALAQARADRDWARVHAWILLAQLQGEASP